MRKKLLCVIISVLAAGILAGCSNSSTDSPQSGRYVSGTGMQQELSFSDADGKYIVFSIENNGAVAIAFSIDNGAPATVLPKSKDEIRVEAKKGTHTYVFKAGPTPNGGEVDFNYDIHQSDG